MPIRWLFFDVGNVLFDDAPQNHFVLAAFHEAIARRHPGVTYEDLLHLRESRIQAGERLDYGRWLADLLPVDEMRRVAREARRHLGEHFDDYNLFDEYSADVLRELKGGYRLGIIANQPAECRASLQRRGILHLFEVVAISDELQKRKPDPGIFQWALEQSGSPSNEAVMVGDRWDNDIEPALAMGFRAVWLRAPHLGYWKSPDDRGAKFLRSCERVPFFCKGPGERVKGVEAVESLADVKAALSSLEMG